jgi:glycosyltransferase involved in cell wall biosynthesis
MLPRASIIIPFLNAAETIERCVRSVLNQSNGNWECLLINDGSTDDTTVKIEPFLSDQRIRLINNPTNLGCSLSRNAGIRLARSDYLIVLDADDEASKDRVARTIDIFDRYESLALFAGACDGGKCEESHAADGNRNYQPSPSISQVFTVEKHTLMFSCPFVHSTVAYRKSLFYSPSFVSYNPSFLVAHDYDLYRQIASIGCSIGYVNELLCFRHETGKGLMSRMATRMVSETIEIKSRCIYEMFPMTSFETSKYLSMMLTYAKFVSESQYLACRKFIQSDELRLFTSGKIISMLTDRFNVLESST